MEFDADSRDRVVCRIGKHGLLVQDIHTQIDRFPSERITVLLAQSCSVNLDTGREHKIQTGTRKCGTEN